MIELRLLPPSHSKCSILARIQYSFPIMLSPSKFIIASCARKSLCVVLSVIRTQTEFRPWYAENTEKSSAIFLFVRPELVLI